MIMLSRIRGTWSITLPLDSSDDQSSSDFDWLDFSTESSLFSDIPNAPIDLTLNDAASDSNQLENVDFSDDSNPISIWPLPAEESFDYGKDNTFIIDESSQWQVPNTLLEPAEGDRFVPLSPGQYPPPNQVDGTFPTDYRPIGSCNHWREKGGYQELLCCGGPVKFDTEQPPVITAGESKFVLTSSVDQCVRRM